MPARTSNFACAISSLLLLGAVPACKKSDRFVDVGNDPTQKRAGKGGGGAGGSQDEAGSDAAGSGVSGQGGGDTPVAGGGGGSTDGDSGSDAEDAGPPPDRSCEAASEGAEFSTSVQFSDESGFGVTTGLTGFGVAFQAPSSGAGNCGALGAMPVATLGEYKTPVTLFGDCSASIFDVTLLHVSDGYRLVWVDNSIPSAGAELQTVLLADSLKPPAELTRTRLTTNDVRELGPVMTTINGATYLAWIAADGPQREVDLQRLDQAGDPQVVLAADRGYRATRLALGQLGKDHGALAFVDEEGQRGIWLVPIDETGRAAAEPTLLSDLVNTGNTVDIATREQDGGVVVYSVDVDATQPEVRFRRLSKLGAFLGDEIKIASAPVKARDASVTRLGDGYVVAYREVSSTDPTRAEIRLSLITKEGTVMRDSVGRPITYLAGEASARGGRITARISVDGQLLLAFVDSDGSDRKFRLLRKRLDCAL